MRLLIATAQVPFVRGGAEMLADSLVKALRQHGHEAEIAAIPFKWYPAPKLLDHMLACRLLDLSEFNGVPVDRVLALKFPAYLIPHPHKVAWLLHQHRSAYELWGGPFGDLEHHPEGAAVRDAIRAADLAAFTEMAAVHTISGTVSERLRRFNGVDSTVLYPPPDDAEHYRTEDAQPYLFCPSRIETIKRQSLMLDALTHCRQPVKLVFCGLPSVPAYGELLRQRARDLNIDDRVTWLGAVSQADKLRLYAQSSGVVFCPLQEDLGYVTMEAMLAGKPVITCTDAGGPLEFVEHGHTGWVAEPLPEALAEAMDQLWAAPARARERGLAGLTAYQRRNISWTSVVQALTA